MVNKKGFVFIETILTIVVLTTTLVLLYTSYSRNVISERRRLYYDDIAYVYKTIAIRDAFDRSLNYTKFQFALDNNLNDSYIYVFSSGSSIFDDPDLMKRTRDLYHFKILIYVPYENIAIFKNCAKDPEHPIDAKCSKTLDKIEIFGDATFLDYVSTINVLKKDNGKLTGILISLIYEAKNGGEEIDKGAYENCIQREAYKEKYGVYESEDMERYTVSQRRARKSAAVEWYREQNLHIDMRCENAYYNSWVYV